MTLTNMLLDSLQLVNFKNYTEVQVGLSPKVNCFVGPNGAGKTNLLDAIYYLSFCKSYFNPADMQNIRHSESFFALNGYYRRNGSLDHVQCIQQRESRKVFKLNKKEYDRLADHIGLLPLVIITPSDAVLIQGGSEDRRKYVDSVISQFDRLYLDSLLSYNKALMQRNALLKAFAEHGRFDEHALAIYDEKMLSLGNEIFEKRRQFLESFVPVFASYYKFISLDKEEVGIEYQSQLNTQDMAALLKASLTNDRSARYTTAGVHKDELVFTIGGYPVKRFGSQGQQKSFLVAVKLAQFDYIRQIKGYMPILLLDDIFDKLDVLRIQQMMKLVSENNFGQIFITDTHRERIEYIFKEIETEIKVFEVRNGAVTETVYLKQANDRSESI
jgi:DNA replication and repair protein RecF